MFKVQRFFSLSKCILTQRLWRNFNRYYTRQIMQICRYWHNKWRRSLTFRYMCKGLANSCLWSRLKGRVLLNSAIDLYSFDLHLIDLIDICIRCMNVIFLFFFFFLFSFHCFHSCILYICIVLLPVVIHNSPESGGNKDHAIQYMSSYT